MKKIITLLCFLSFSTTLLYPSIQDIVTIIEEIEGTETPAPKEEEENKNESKGIRKSSSTIEDDIDFFFVLLELWSLNFFTQFTRAPYYGGQSLLFIPSEIPFYSKDYNHWWYSTGIGSSYLHNIGLGGFATFDGCFYSFLGPQLEVFSFVDQNKDLLYGTKLGGNLAIIQTNPFSLYLYVQYALLHSNLLSSPYSGTCVGLEIRSFIANPITFKLKIDFSDFGTVQLTDFTLLLGVMIQKNELYCGYRSWTFNQGEIQLFQSRGATLGYKYYL